MNFFGDTPIALIILELALIPLFLWIGHKIGKLNKSTEENTNALDKVADVLERLNGSISDIDEDLQEAAVRDKGMSGSLKGIHEKLDRLLDWLFNRK